MGINRTGEGARLRVVGGSEEASAVDDEGEQAEQRSAANRRDQLWQTNRQISWPEFLEAYGQHPDWEVDAAAAEEYHRAIVRWFEHNERVTRPRPLLRRLIARLTPRR